MQTTTNTAMLAGRPVPVATAQRWISEEVYLATLAERDQLETRIAELEAQVLTLAAALKGLLAAT